MTRFGQILNRRNAATPSAPGGAPAGRYSRRPASSFGMSPDRPAA